MPNAKYDWDTHLPRMIELYLEQYSIPKIREAIQDRAEGFTPSLATVYDKLRSEGYPTDPTERRELLGNLNIARWPSELSIHRNNGQRPKLHVAFSTSENVASLVNPQNLVSSRATSLRLNRQEYNQETHNNNAKPNVSRLTNRTRQWPNSSPSPRIPREQVRIDNLFSLSEETSTTNGNYTHFNTDLRGQDNTQLEFGGINSFPDLGTEYPEGIFRTPSLSPSELHRDTTEPQIETNGSSLFKSDPIFTELRPETPASHHPMSIADDENLLYVSDTPSPFTQPAASANHRVSRPTGTAYLGGKFLPWWRKEIPKHNGCLTPEKRNSVSTNDSGYASGRNSPGNLLVEGERGHPRSLMEFNGLYRVPCLRLHEPRRYNKDYMPQPTDRFKETEKCPHCQYSGIHNLSWSVKQLKREVFMSELRLDSIYNVKDLDTAGNSALHYAAVGGATFEHFVALISAGADPYQLNTAGQLFLHYLTPQLKKYNCESFDAHLVTTFNLDLVNLLNHFRRTLAFRWRDNEGTTAIEALTRNVNDIKVAHQILGAMFNAGHLSEEELDQSKKALRNIGSMSKRFQSLPTHMQQDSSLKRNFENNEERQKRAWDILNRAATAPSYVDPDTGDNALHALARLRFCQTGAHMKILATIRKLVLKEDVDLNLHNRERDSPIASFICEDHFRGIRSDETGATMSKYLDALLWKDPLRRIPNKINVNMRNREGATALYYAAIRGRPDSVRSLIEAGANVNATLVVDGHSISILQATQRARSKAVHQNDTLQIHLLNNVISYLEHDDAVAVPTPFDERRLCPNSVRFMPM